MTHSITAAQTPVESGSTPDPSARTLTMEQLTAMLTQAREAAILKTADKQPTPKPFKARHLGGQAGVDFRTATLTVTC